jgi:hypothetical protein
MAALPLLPRCSVHASTRCDFLLEHQGTYHHASDSDRSASLVIGTRAINSLELWFPEWSLAPVSPKAGALSLSGTVLLVLLKDMDLC